MKVVPSGSGYDFAQDWANPLCGSRAQGRGGFAGSFASDGETAYWVDTAGALWAHNLANGAPRWPAHPAGMPLAPLLGGVEAFTNTEPAIDLSSGLVYVTLRNFRKSGDPFSLSGGTHTYQGETLHAPGAPGALAAIDRATGVVKWKHIFRPEPGADPLWEYPAINTAPLVIRARGVVVVGDAIGAIHAFDLATGDPATLFIDENCADQSTLDLTREGERPMRSGQASWSQVSGVGVDPAFGSQLLLMGVNVFREGEGTKSFGRMAALKAGDPYNLRWADAELQPGPRVQAGQQVTFQGTVTMDLATQPLGVMRDGAPAEVRWWVVGDDYRRPLDGTVTLPDTLTTNSTAPAEITFTLTDKDPATGFIMGVIDPPALVLHGAGALADTPLQAAALTTQCHQGLRHHAEIVYTPEGTDLTRGLTDNTTMLPYEKAQELDLAVELQAPATVPYQPDGRYTVTIRMRNLSNTAVERPGAMRQISQDSTSLGIQTLHRRPYLFTPYEERVDTIQVPMGACGSRSVVRVELNAANDPPETDRSNNAVQVLTTIGPCGPTGGGSSGGGGSASQGGGGRSIIVPPDCIPNPDLTDPRLCTNYDKTLDDW